MARDGYSWSDKNIQRCCISHSGFRLDGLGDILPRMKGASVFDIGANRGHVSLDCMAYGATTLHGVEIDKDRCRVCNENFADYRHVKAKFEQVDLIGGPAALKKAFGHHFLKEYDFILMLAVYHKLRRVMELDALLYLVDHFAHHCGRFFVWRGSREEKPEFENVLLKREFKLVHYSEISECEGLPDESPLRQQPSAIWAKTKAT